MLATGLQFRSIFWKILSAFLLFAFCLSVGMGTFIYMAVDRLGSFLVEEQVRPVMGALMAAERQARQIRDSKAVNLEIDELARAINGVFLVGSQVPEEWATLSDGLHFQAQGFVYIARDSHEIYSLSGSSKGLRNFLRRIAGLCFLAGGICLLLAVGTAWLLSRLLAQPMKELAASIRQQPRAETLISGQLLARQDEIGSIARAARDYQAEAAEFVRREAAFTGDVSHELRTPLAVMTGAVEILQALNRDPALDCHLERLGRTLEGTTQTMSALLCLARKTGTVTELLDLEDLIKNAAAHGDACQITVTALRPARVMGNRQLAEVALGNLLKNACRYSSNGKVEINLLDARIEIVNQIGTRSVSGCLSDLRLPCHSDSAGLGLSIAERACSRLGWSLEIAVCSSRAVARVTAAKGP